MLHSWFMGKLSLDAIPFHTPIIMGATAFMAVLFLAVLLLITVKRKWMEIWTEWVSSVINNEKPNRSCSRK